MVAFMENNRAFDARLAELTSRWNAHQDLRRDHASVAELAASRRELDAARDRLHALRAA